MMAAAAAVEALDAVAALAESAANQRGASFLGSDLRLFAGRSRTDSNLREIGDISATGSLISPFSLGRTYELLLAPQARRKKGAHLTPEAIARQLVALMPSPAVADTVLDPAVGGAAFLLAAADELVAAGTAPTDVLDQVAGIDIDPGAVAVAEAALALWGLDHDVEPRHLPGIYTADGLLASLPQASLVVGNPPFLNQLRASSSHTAGRRAALREKWGDIVGAYTDDAWLFLAAGVGALTSDGSLAMVQPVSLLAARHANPVRCHVGERASMTGLWLARDQVFDAAVQVCGVVLGVGRHRSKTVERRVGADFAVSPHLPSQPTASEWGSAAAATLGVPAVRLQHNARTVGDLAHATAGFRDQFYGFVPFVAEWLSDDVPETHARLITVGMIDVLQNAWGTREFRFAKQPFRRPVIDLEALAVDNPKLDEWSQARRRPKLLMATQTRVVEIWVDTDGGVIPATPVLSIEPYGEDPDDLWMLAAALSAPAISAHFLAANFGTAMSLNAMKLAARDVLAAPLPNDDGAWRDAAQLLRSSPPDLSEFAETMGRAYGTNDPALVQWWKGRLPNRSGQ